jgi:hypothetical protein
MNTDAIVSTVQRLASSVGLSSSAVEAIEMDHIWIVVVILYIAFVSIWTPRSFLLFFNHPAIRVLILGMIIWIFTWNKLLALLVAVAFVATVSIDQSMLISHSATNNLKQILDRSSSAEHFENNSHEDDDHDEHHEDHEHESFENEDDDDEEVDYLRNKKLTDTFRNLHDSIHQLEQFMSKEKNNK